MSITDINKEKAIALIFEYINTAYNKHNEEGKELLAIKDIIPYEDYGWTFFYDTKKSIDSNNWRYSLAGNLPIFIFKDGGKMYLVHSETDEAEIVEKHRQGNYSSETSSHFPQGQVA